MDGRHEEARLETKAAALPERLVVEWPLQASLEAGPPLPRTQLPARVVTGDRRRRCWDINDPIACSYKADASSAQASLRQSFFFFFLSARRFWPA